MEIQEIKSRLTLSQVLKYYRLKPDKSMRLCCPFHDDKTPSMQVYYKTHTVYCFSSNCKTHGKSLDVIDFIMHKEVTDKHTAIKKAKEMLGIRDDLGITPQVNNKNMLTKLADREQFLGNMFTYFKNAVHNSKPSQDYMRSRGLDPTVIEIGYNTAQFHHGQRKDPVLINNCVNAGLLAPWGKNCRTPEEQSYKPFAKCCIVFALRNRSNQITGMYFRSTINNDSQKHYYLKDRSGLYPCYPAPESTKLILTEAVIDAAALLQIQEITKEYGLLACYGTNGLTKEHITAIKELKQLKEIIFAFDNDEAGSKAVEKYSNELNELLPNVTLSTVELPENEDVNSVYVSHEPGVFEHLLENRVFLSNENKKDCTVLQQAHTTQVKTPAVSVAELDTKYSYKLRYSTGTAHYYVQGGVPKLMDSMKITLVAENFSTGQKTRNKIDLYDDKQVEKLCKDVSEKLSLRKDLLEGDIYKLTDLLDEYREKEILNNHGKKEASAEAYPMTQQEKNTAMEILKKPDLISHICEMLGQAGIVGEEKNRIFLFATALSHVTHETLHVLIQGSSGSGKTRQLRVISDCMPPERVVRLTRVSDKSFYNYPEHYLSHKLISLEDVDGLSEDSEFAYRELVSNGELISSVSVKHENGHIGTAQKIVRGPIASMACTTNGSMYEDNISRMFIVAVDESLEQTQKVISYQNARSAGKIDIRKEHDIKKQLQHVVRMIKPLPVKNPYADRIHLPEEAHKLRRLNDLFKIFIHQITLINQYRRKKDEQGRIVSTLEDVETAIEIMFDSIVLKVDELDGSLRQFYEKLKEYIKKTSNGSHQQYHFTQREVRHGMNISKTQLFRYLSELTELEYIQQSGGYANKGFRYKIEYWDDYKLLRERIKKQLHGQLEVLKLERQS